MNKQERYDMRRFGARLVIFILLVSALVVFGIVNLYEAGEISSFRSYIHRLGQDQLFGLAYSNYDKTYKFHMTDEVHRPQVLALGSSRIMAVKRSVVSSRYSFYNAGGAIQNVCELPLFVKGLHYDPEFVIVNIDQWWFNPAFEVERLSFSPSVYDEPEFDFTKLGKCLCSFYEDLVRGKISLKELFASENIGLNAIFHENGFAADGSRYQGDMIKVPELQDDYNFNDVLARIHNGVHRFQFGEMADSSLVTVVDEFLSHCVARGTRVVAFLPPFAPFVYKKMQDTGKYGYMSQLYGMLLPVFEKYQGCSLYDFTDVTEMGAHNYDFEDGFHGSEIIYNGMIRQMIIRDSTLARFFVSEEEMGRLDSAYHAKNIRYHSIE